jgi:hypothetical protein
LEDRQRRGGGIRCIMVVFRTVGACPFVRKKEAGRQAMCASQLCCWRTKPPRSAVAQQNSRRSNRDLKRRTQSRHSADNFVGPALPHAPHLALPSPGQEPCFKTRS